MSERRDNLQSAARVLPRADQLVRAAAPAFRCGLRTARPRAAPESAGASPRVSPKPPRCCAPSRCATASAPVASAHGRLAHRLERGHRARLATARKRLESLRRVLESISYARCWSAVSRWCAGPMAPSAAAPRPIRPGEHLTLTFADGEKHVTADGAAPRAPRKAAHARRSRQIVLNRERMLGRVSA